MVAQPMKICVIGNSHIASLKLGWDSIAGEFPGLELTFFGARGYRMEQLQRQGAKLVPQTKALQGFLSHTSGGLAEINLPKYHACLVYGLFLRLPKMAPHLSEAVKSCVAADALQASVSYETLGKIRAASPIPVFVGHDPLTCFKGETRPTIPYRAALAYLRNAVDLANVQILEQPKHTLEQDRFTRSSYLTGAIKLEQQEASPMEDQPSDNMGHMNGDFGAAFLRAALPVIAAK